MPTPDDPPAEELTNEQILSRLDEVLKGTEDDDDLLEDDVPPDIDIPDEEEDREEDPWSDVEPPAAEDLALPGHHGDTEPGPEAWGDVDDLCDEDVPVEDVEERLDGDPWSPVDYGVMPEAPGGASAPSNLGFALPLARPQPGLLPAPRTLPWRSTADLMDPALPALLCVADPTATGSRLLVAAWAWADEAAGDRLRFRISDDGPEIEVAPSTPHEAVLVSTLKIADVEVRVRLHLEAVRDQRGVVLGRDVLAGRFIVDPSREDWSEDPE